MPLDKSLQLANLAAGIVVSHFGTWAVSRQEILSMLGTQTQGKVLDRDEAVSAAARMRADGLTVPAWVDEAAAKGGFYVTENNEPK